MRRFCFPKGWRKLWRGRKIAEVKGVPAASSAHPKKTSVSNHLYQYVGLLDQLRFDASADGRDNPGSWFRAHDEGAGGAHKATISFEPTQTKRAMIGRTKRQ